MIGSMNGEIRIWDVRAPEKPLYENLAQPLGLAGLAVHTGAPILATYVPSLHMPSTRAEDKSDERG